MEWGIIRTYNAAKKRQPVRAQMHPYISIITFTVQDKDIPSNISTAVKYHTYTIVDIPIVRLLLSAFLTLQMERLYPFVFYLFIFSSKNQFLQPPAASSSLL